MCLGIPARIVAVTDAHQKLAKVEVSGVRREVNLACVLGDGEDAEDLLGAWVLVHVGFAMSVIDEREAARTLALLAEMGALAEELGAAGSPGADTP